MQAKKKKKTTTKKPHKTQYLLHTFRGENFDEEQDIYINSNYHPQNYILITKGKVVTS